jgi:hypothetical protein
MKIEQELVRKHAAREGVVWEDGVRQPKRGCGPGDEELALFVIWSKARDRQTEIFAAIGARFEIRGVHEIVWEPGRVNQNFARFYQGRSVAPYGAFFRHQKGGDPFLLVTVVDPAPCYEARMTHRGPEVLNARCFDLKQEIRGMVGGVMRVHATDSSAEAARDLLLLLGMTPQQYLMAHRTAWKGQIEVVRRNLSGAAGWGSLEEIFTLLNRSIRYVVLRDDGGIAGSGRTLVLLTDNYHELVRLLNARPRLWDMPRWGGRFTTRVSHAEIGFEIRFPGDGYYGEEWVRRLLSERQLDRSGRFVPALEDRFASLAYHAVMHNPVLTEENVERLEDLEETLHAAGMETPCRLTKTSSVDDSSQALLVYLGRTGCPCVQPRDPMVYYNFKAAGRSLPRLRLTQARVKRGWFIATSRLGFPWRYLFVGVRQTAMQLFPGIRMLWPSYRRLARSAAPMKSLSAGS